MTEKIRLADQILLDAVVQRRKDFMIDPSRIYGWWSPCVIRTLLVTDGALDYGRADFGLSTFVETLLYERPSYVRFDVTLAHLRSDLPASSLMDWAPEIARRIPNFRFDEPTHFSPDMYDQVWLFGFDPAFNYAANPPQYAARAADQARYPSGRLGDEELRSLSAFMNGGGGVFATGDHGELGKALCGAVSRVRSMRHWEGFPTTADDNVNEVSMTGARRNDTNAIGNDPGSQFSDQSDDVPQRIDLKLYSSRIDFFRNARYPHPVLCGRNGRLDVLPDHPHEGECRVPGDLGLAYDYDGSREYPNAIDGSGQVSPDVIATSHVPAGNDAYIYRNPPPGPRSKTPTDAHTFGAISAYDGHLADIGRVVCDATWHHFVNVNLIGIFETGGFDDFARPGEYPSKHDGFLSSPQGRAALAKIRNYYTNIGVWIARPSNHACVHAHFWRLLAYKERIMEAALVNPTVSFDKIPLDVFRSIGVHARDVLDRAAGQCQTMVWVLDWIRTVWAEVPPLIDPWSKLDKRAVAKLPKLPIFDPTPLIDVALGGALVGLRQEAPYPPPKIDAAFADRSVNAAMNGASRALALAWLDVGKGFRDADALMRSKVRAAARKKK